MSEHMPVEEAAAPAAFEFTQRGWAWKQQPTWCPDCTLPSAVPMRRICWQVDAEGVERIPVEGWSLYCSEHGGWIG